MKLTTKRLTICPMQTEELKGLIKKYEGIVPELSKAYGEMLESCMAHPRESIWYTSWKMCLKSGGEEIGYAGFKGIKSDGRAEIGYGVDEEYQGNGYATEAVTAMCDWALKQNGITGIEAETEADNEASKHVLKKVGFCPTGVMGEEGPRYLLKKY